MALLDSFDRKIDYLRISITDHCNLKCYYCTPFSSCSHLERSKILTYEELLNLARAAAAAGITKIRVTGGEPLVRKGVVEFCRMLSKIDGLKSLALTTNGIYLKEMAEPLFKAGVRRINISLDTLRPERFEKITGYDWLSRVLAGIKHAEQIGMYPIKIKTCLFSREEIDIKTPLKAGAIQNEIIDIFEQALANKPSGHHLNAKEHQNACQRAMRATGG